MDQTNQLTINVQETTLSLSNPKQIMEFGKELEKYIILNKLSITIQNKNYCLADGWKWAGAAFGLTAVCEEPVPMHERNENVYIITATRERSSKGRLWNEDFTLYAALEPCEPGMFESFVANNKNVRESVRKYFNYKCTAKVIRIADGTIISTGYSTCSNLESKKLSFDEYAVCSMAQTRAIAKGFRNLLGYVMNAAGFEGTPAEEMEEFVDKEDPKEQKKEADRPAMQEEQFIKTIAALKEGKVTLETVQKYYTLTDDQMKQIESINQPPPPPEKEKPKRGRKPKKK